jgi:HEPN domain
MAGILGSKDLTTEPGVPIDLIKSYKMDLVHQLFVGTADENYITSRWCFFSHFYTDFFWLAAHALEKYLKAVLLLNGSTSKKFQHNIVELYSSVKPIGDDLLPSMLKAPEGLETGRDVSPEDFFAYLYARGNTHNRYMIYGYSAHEQDIFMVDKMVFSLRRLTVPLEDRAFPPHVKSAITYRQRLTGESYYYPDLLLPLDSLVKSTENSPARVAALNLNLTAFTPDNFTHVAAPIARIAFQNPVIERRIFAPLQSGDPQIAAWGLQIAEWCLENITLPDGKRGEPNIVKEIKEAMEIARKTIG